MRTIEFTETELSELLSFYRQERDKALRKIAEIESILSLPPSKATPETGTLFAPAPGKRSANKPEPSPVISSAASPDAPAAPSGTPQVTERKKRKAVARPRPKPEKISEEESEFAENGLEIPGNVTHLSGKWIKFITDLLEKQGRVIAADDIVSEAIYRYDIADEKHQTTRQVIYNTLYKLDSTKRMIGSCTIPGRKGKRYGLKKWFTPEGEIKESFLAKAT
jgi:hypothetical protein